MNGLLRILLMGACLGMAFVLLIYTSIHVGILDLITGYLNGKVRIYKDDSTAQEQ